MTEVLTREMLTRPAYEAAANKTTPLDELLDQDSQLEDDADTSAETQAVEIEDTREVSPLASRIEAATNRVITLLETGKESAKGYLNNRAINKAHGEALAEDNRRTQEAQDEAFASYEDNIARSEEIDEAYDMNDKFDQEAAHQQARAEKIAEREQKIQDAKENIAGFGRATLTHLKTAGFFTLGLGVLTAEAGGRAVKRGAEATADALSPMVEYTKSAYIDGKRKAEERKETRATAKAEARHEREEAEKNARLEREKTERERVDRMIEAAKKKALLAIARKAERRAKWISVKEKVTGAYNSVRNVPSTSKAAIGRFGRRVRATSVAAATAATTAGKEAWATN